MLWQLNPLHYQKRSVVMSKRQSSTLRTSLDPWRTPTVGCLTAEVLIWLYYARLRQKTLFGANVFLTDRSLPFEPVESLFVDDIPDSSTFTNLLKG